MTTAEIKAALRRVGDAAVEAVEVAGEAGVPEDLVVKGLAGKEGEPEAAQRIIDALVVSGRLCRIEGGRLVAVPQVFADLVDEVPVFQPIGRLRGVALAAFDTTCRAHGGRRIGLEGFAVLLRRVGPLIEALTGAGFQVSEASALYEARGQR